MVQVSRSSVALVPPRFQVSCMIITTLVLSYVVTDRISIFHPTDSMPSVQTHTPLSLVDFGGMPNMIDVGLYVDNFSKFDMVKNEFTANCILWFVLNPGTISLDALSKFALKRGVILERSDPITKMLGEKLFIQYNIRISFATQLDFSSYPLDDHYITLQIVNDFITPREALFVTKEQSFIINPAVKIYGWKLVGLEQSTGYIVTHLEAHNPDITSSSISSVFSLAYSFMGLRFAISVFLPLMMIFFISVFCLSFADVARMGIAVGTVTALLAYRFVIDSISPAVGYFMLSDYLFYSVLASTFVIFFIIVLDAFGTYMSVSGKKTVVALLHIALLAMVTYFTHVM